MSICRVNIKWVLSFILFSSLFFNTPGNVYVFYFAFLANFAYLLLNLFYRFRLKVEPFIYFYALFFVWALLSLFWARDIQLSLDMSWRLILIIFAMLFMVNLQDRSGSFLNGGYYGLLAGVVLNLPLTFSDAFYISGRFSGTTINPNHISLFCGFVIFISILNKRNINRLVLLLSLFLSSYLIFQTGSRKGLLLALVSLSIFAFKLDEKKATVSYSAILSLVGFGSIFLLISNLEFLSSIHPIFNRFYEFTQMDITDLSRDGFSGDSSTRWRLIFIVDAYNLFLENPLKGIGLDNFKTIYSEDLYSHNNYVELLSTLGLVGLIAYYAFYFSIFKCILKSKSIFCLFIMFFFLSMDFAMVSYFERMYILPLILIYYIAKRDKQIESTTHN